MTHVYDGTPNDGFCECGKPRADAVHQIEPWYEAWQRSLRIQRAQREYDYCRVAKSVTATEFFKRDA